MRTSKLRSLGLWNWRQGLLSYLDSEVEIRFRLSDYVNFLIKINQIFNYNRLLFFINVFLIFIPLICWNRVDFNQKRSKFWQLNQFFDLFWHLLFKLAYLQSFLSFLLQRVRFIWFCCTNFDLDDEFGSKSLVKVWFNMI